VADSQLGDSLTPEQRAAYARFTDLYKNELRPYFDEIMMLSESLLAFILILGVIALLTALNIPERYRKEIEKRNARAAVDSGYAATRDWLP
jgi:hypothetical protein